MTNTISNLKIAFRVDASSWIGSGHVMRCATLGLQLKSKGAHVHFICRSMPGDFCGWLTGKGFEVHQLTAVSEPSNKQHSLVPHVKWLGVDAETDKKQCLELLAKFELFDWLVVDHYSLDSDWESSMRSKARKVMVIDDVADRKHDCDLLLDQNIFYNAEERYLEKVPVTCKMLLGPRFALLQAAYSQLAVNVPLREAKVKRMLVFFGGFDSADLTGLVVECFLELQCENISLDVVVGQNHPYLELFRDIARREESIKVYVDLPSLSSIMAEADLAIGASGATSWERCCLGLPAIVITLSENQQPIAAELSRLKCIHLLGHFDEITKDMMLDVLKFYIDEGIPQGWSERCKDLVDGRGVYRVLDAMEVRHEN